MSVRDLDVLVVGAGPVGLLLACELARRDVPIRVIDKLPGPTTESRAIVVHARSLEMLERVGVAEEIISCGVRTTAGEFHAGGRTEARVPLDTVDSPYPFTVTLPQTDTERILAERLRNLGVGVERGTELLGFDQDEDGIEATLRLGDGGEQKVGCAFIAGTDGSRSTVRHAVGARLEGAFKGDRFLLADVEAEHDLDRSALHTFFTEGGPLLVFPMRGERTRIIARVPDQAFSREEPTLPEAQEVVDGRTGGIRLRRAHWLTVFEIHHAQVPSYRYGRALLAGDAAHVHSPAAGQGMNTGMQDSFNLAWKLAAVTRGVASPGLLDSYHEERHPIAARVIAQTTRLTAMGTLRRRSEQVIRDHLIHVAAGLAPIRRRMASQTEETDIGYRDSPIVDSLDHHRGGPVPGEAAPDVSGLPGGRSLHGLLSEAVDHTLLWVILDRSELDRDRMRLSAAAFPQPAAVRQVVVAVEGIAGTSADVLIPDPEGLVARRYGVGGRGKLFVIRPDGYVGMRAAIEDATRLRDYLARLYRKSS